MNQQRLAPVRVLFFDHVPRMSGAEQSLADLVIGLKAGPVEPVVVLPDDGPLAQELRAHGVLVRMVPMSKRMLETSRVSLSKHPLLAISRLFAFLAASFRMWRLIREIKPAIVHTNTLKSHLLAMLPCKAARIPLVWHVRDILPRGWLLHAFLMCARLASVIIVPSRAVAEPFRGRKRLLRKIRLIPNGVRVRDFQEARNDRSLREMMAVGASDPVVGIVGRIAPWKGQEVFLRAAAMLAQRHPRAHFAIIGAVLFPENDLPFEQHLHRQVMALGLQGRVTFCGWQPAPEAMAAIDVFVHASQEPEPFGRVIVEAMAAGKPVVAAAGGAVTEIVPPAAGFVVPPARPELLADALDRLLEDRKLRKRMGEAAAAVADNFFPVQRTVQSVAQLYRGLAQHSMRRAMRRRQILRKAGLDPKKLKKIKGLKRPAPRPEWTTMTTPPVHASREQTPKFDAPRFDAPKFDAPKFDAPKFDAPKFDAPRFDAPRFDAPPPEAPTFDAPAYEPPTYDPPKPKPSRKRSIPAVRPAARADVLFEEPPVDDSGFVMPFTGAPEPSEALRPAARAAVAVMPAEQPLLAPPVVTPERPLRRRARVSKPKIHPEPAPVLVEPAPTFTPTHGIYHAKPVYDLLKRMLDMSLALAIVVLGMPVWIVVALAIKLESRGPVFFKGTVVGRDSKAFTYFKFRSMRMDGDDSAHRKFIERYVRDNAGHEHEGEIVYKLLGDDRITAVGRWIRKFSIDEIPQVINVLRGDMSFVGPRPPLVYEFELYDARMKERLRVKPGITGMQQVWHRHTASFEDKLALDMKYIGDRSIWLDIKLILHTIVAMTRGH